MSFNFNDAGGFSVNGLSINSAELTIACWSVNELSGGSEPLVTLYDSFDNNPAATMTIAHDGGNFSGTWRNSAGVEVTTLSSNATGGYKWRLHIMSISATGPTATHQEDGGTAATSTPSSTWPGAALDTLLWGVSTGGAYYTNRSAHLAIWNKALNSTERGELWNGGSGGGGKNPTAVATANLLYYWYDSATAYVGGVAFSGVGTTPTWGTGDTPTVDAPTPIASGVPKTTKLTMLGVG